MRNIKPSTNTYLNDFIQANHPNVKFFPEPMFQNITGSYPCITVQYDSFRKTKTLGFWEMDVQVDILVDQNNREYADRLTIDLLQYLDLTVERAGVKRRFPKYRFVDLDGKPTAPTRIANSDVIYYLGEDVNSIYEPDYPELIHNTFSLTLTFKDDN